LTPLLRHLFDHSVLLSPASCHQTPNPLPPCSAAPTAPSDPCAGCQQRTCGRRGRWGWAIQRLGMAFQHSRPDRQCHPDPSSERNHHHHWTGHGSDSSDILHHSPEDHIPAVGTFCPVVDEMITPKLAASKHTRQARMTATWSAVTNARTSHSRCCELKCQNTTPSMLRQWTLVSCDHLMLNYCFCSQPMPRQQLLTTPSSRQNKHTWYKHKDQSWSYALATQSVGDCHKTSARLP